MQCVKSEPKKKPSYNIRNNAKTESIRHMHARHRVRAVLVSQDRYDTINAHKQQITSCAVLNEQMYDGSQRQRRKRRRRRWLSNRHWGTSHSYTCTHTTHERKIILWIHECTRTSFFGIRFDWLCVLLLSDLLRRRANVNCKRTCDHFSCSRRVARR